jgi:hypothetical protein
MIINLDEYKEKNETTLDKKAILLRTLYERGELENIDNVIEKVKMINPDVLNTPLFSVFVSGFVTGLIVGSEFTAELSKSTSPQGLKDFVEEYLKK